MDSPNRMPTLSFTFLELLDRSFRVYRENFGTFVVLSAFITIPITLINGFLNLASSSAILPTSGLSRTQLSNNWGLLCLAPLISLTLILIQVVLTDGMLTYMTSEYLFGRRVTIGEAYQAVKDRFSRLGCSFILFCIILFALAVPIVFIGAVCFPAWAGLGLVAYIGIATFAYLTPVIVLENVNTTFGLNRAWWLGKSRFWTAFGVIFLIYLLGVIFGVIFNLLAQFLTASVLNTQSSVTFQVIILVFSTIVGVVIVPVMPIALTLLYYDTRSRLEGLDLALATLDNAQGRPIHIESPTPGPFLNSRDVVNVLALVGGGLVLTLLFSATVAAILNQFAPGLSSLQR